MDSHAEDFEPHWMAERKVWLQEWVVVRRVHIVTCDCCVVFKPMEKD